MGASCAILASCVVLAPLAWRDPKRLRAALRLGQELRPALSRLQRRVLGWTGILPGLMLALAGQWPAFLIWLGAAAALGWALAQGLAPRPPSRTAHPSPKK